MSEQIETYDVVVLGSGAGGLAAAALAQHAGASVAVFEKLERVGGTTAVSGGVSWIPAHGRGPAPDDFSREDALTYLRSFPDLGLRDEMIVAYVDAGEAMLDALEAATDVRFWVSEGYPDYKPEYPGGRPDGGRSFNPSPLDFTDLGEWAGRVYAFPSDWSDVGFDAETLARLRQTSLSGQDFTASTRFMGQALVGGLLKALVEGGATVRTGSAATRVLVEAGRVVGAVIVDAQGEHVVQARRAVVLATGGFEWNQGLVDAFLRAPMSAPVSPPGHVGDGLRIAVDAGAQLDNMSEAWWATSVKMPDDFIDGEVRSRSIRSERTRPGCITVNPAGHRFANEAQDYNSLGGAAHQLDPETLRYQNLDAWMIFDQRHLDEYGFLHVRAGESAPDWFNASASVAELATRTGIDADGLESTITEWNAHLAAGEGDPQFHRGESRYDLFWGDPRLPADAGRTLGPIAETPYYAVRMHMGTTGTKGGPRVTVDAQVTDWAGNPIEGFYAVGNVAASAMGGAYPGAGATIGPAMVFAYRAMRHALGG